jgi:DNA polymerase IV
MISTWHRNHLSGTEILSTDLEIFPTKREYSRQPHMISTWHRKHFSGSEILSPRLEIFSGKREDSRQPQMISTRPRNHFSGTEILSPELEIFSAKREYFRQPQMISTRRRNHFSGTKILSTDLEIFSTKREDSRQPHMISTRPRNHFSGTKILSPELEIFSTKREDSRQPPDSADAFAGVIDLRWIAPVLFSRTKKILTLHGYQMISKQHDRKKCSTGQGLDATHHGQRERRLSHQRDPGWIHEVLSHVDREILHITVPAFPIALARVIHAQLRGRPVAVAALNSERALLQCVSAEATSEGVHAGTPIFQARKCCPSLIVIAPDPHLMAKGSRSLMELSGAFTPIIEPGLGRIFLDLTASRRLFGPARDVAARLEKSIACELGVEAMAGAGTNKLVSRVAADFMARPGVYDVFHGTERSFLAPFPVAVLPGVGGARQTLLLRDLNLQRVEQVATLSVPQLRLAVGPFAPLLHDRACGIDRSPVQPPRLSTEIVEEGLLDQEENDDAILICELLRLVEGCGLRLRRLGKGARKITLSVMYADGVTEQGKKTLASATSLDLQLLGAVEELFFSTCKRRQRVRGIRLSCDQVAEAPGQLELFAPVTHKVSQKQIDLQGTLDALREKHGEGSIRWGKGVPVRRENVTLSGAPPVWDPEQSRHMTQTKN